MTQPAVQKFAVHMPASEGQRVAASAEKHALTQTAFFRKASKLLMTLADRQAAGAKIYVEQDGTRMELEIIL